MRACRSHSEWLDLWDVHTPFASGLQSVRDLVLRKYVPGSWEKGGNVASVGHLYGFGNTLDKALTAVVGCKERGRQVDGPLDHSTGKGWVKDHAYGDGWVEKNGSRKWTGAQYRIRYFRLPTLCE